MNKLTETLQAFENVLSGISIPIAQAASLLRALDVHRASVLEAVKSEPIQTKGDA